MKKIAFITLLFVYSLSIYAKGKMYVSVQKPAAVTIPIHIKTLAVIDRTDPEENRKSLIESVITGEGLNTDAEGVQNAMEGLLSMIGNSDRYQTIRTNIKYSTDPAKGLFPDQLSWGTIQKICLEQKVDAVISIEYFDSDFLVTNGSKMVDKKDKNGNPIKVKEFFAEGVATVQIGFRIYDPTTKLVQDQRMYKDTRRWTSSGSNLQAAINTLMDRKAAVQRISYDMGQWYGKRIQPVWIRVSRIYYKKPKRSNDLAAGARKAEVNDWDGAIESWEKALNYPKNKVQRRAAHNLALAYEVFGELEKAKEYAQMAYAEYGNKDSKNYVYILNKRIKDQAILDEQLGE